jgi:hypothetical protein
MQQGEDNFNETRLVGRRDQPQQTRARCRHRRLARR